MSCTIGPDPQDHRDHPAFDDPDNTFVEWIEEYPADETTVSYPVRVSIPRLVYISNLIADAEARPYPITPETYLSEFLNKEPTAEIVYPDGSRSKE